MVTMVHREWWPVRWYRYRAVLVGRYSGQRHVIPFLRWRHERDASAWVLGINTAHERFINTDGDPLTWWEYEEIPRD